MKVSDLKPEVRTRVERHMRGNCLYEDLPVRRYIKDNREYIFQEVPYSSYLRYELYIDGEITEVGTLDLDEDLTSQRDYYDASLCKEFETPNDFLLWLSVSSDDTLKYKKR